MQLATGQYITPTAPRNALQQPLNPGLADYPEFVAGEAVRSQLSPDATRILDAIANLPEDERETFDLVRVQEMTQAEAADVIGVGVRTVQRRLNRALFLLAEALPDLRPASSGESSITGSGRWKPSCGTRSTIGPEKSPR